MSTTSATPETIFMLRISLKNIKPEVWRRVLVPGDYTFKELHDVIMAVMGWSDFHMHRFSMKHPVTNREIEIGGVGDLGYGDFLWLPESTKIAHYLINPNQKAVHEYDLGFPWYHNIVFEKTIPAILGEKYPKCIGGKRVPPPEDDPGSDYSDSEHLSKDFDHTRVNFGKCRKSIVKSPEKGQDTSSIEPTGVVSEVEVSASLKKRQTPEANEPPAKRTRVIHIIKSHTSNASVSLTGETTVSSPIVHDVPNSSSSSSEQKSTSNQSQRESGIDKDIEENYGKFIASQMMLVPDLEAREELRSEIQNAIEKYKPQKK